MTQKMMKQILTKMNAIETKITMQGNQLNGIQSEMHSQIPSDTSLYREENQDNESILLKQKSGKFYHDNRKR